MGEVYRATDTRLRRMVAVKLIRDGFVEDRERVRRFESEARAAAALDHPNILTVHDIGTHAGAPYIVSELLEGETLAERLAAGALPVRKAVDIGLQIAHGLGAAHDKGIVHRDVKPSNLWLTRDGRVKILDFGLAKLSEPEMGSSEGATHTTSTSPGTVVGTIGYMSPEQVRGEALDARSDIFALGAVMYETLSGRRAFEGQTAADVMSAILRQDPVELSVSGSAIPVSLDRLVRRCLEKQPEHRFRSAHDLAFALEALTAPSDVTPAAAGSRPGARRLTGAVGGLALVLTVALALDVRRQREPTAAVSAKLTITLPADAPLVPAASVPTPGDGRPALALSRDGRRLVYVALVRGRSQLFVRDMATAEIHPLPGTEGAYGPFLSPDGEWVAFFAGGKLKKTSLATGEIKALTEAAGPGGSWSEDGELYFSPHETGGISKIAASGGRVQRVVTGQFLWPEILPSRRGLLFSDLRGGINLLKEGRIERVCQGFYPRYAPTGHLLVAEPGKLMVVPFELSSLKVTGPPVTVLQDLRTEIFGGAQYTLSQDGTLVYVSGHDSQIASLMWVDRGGRAQPLGLPPAVYGPFDISPDGSKLVVTVFDGSSSDLWLLDISRGSPTRFTSSDAGASRVNTGPLWTPDGRNVVYTSILLGGSASEPEPRGHIFWKPADFSREAVQLTSDEAPRRMSVGSITPDGSALVLWATTPDTGLDLWTLRLGGVDPYAAGPRKPEPFLQTRFVETFPRFSPDGKWIAYVSDESGTREVYVQPFPGHGGKVQISIGGGGKPSWHPNGREVFYLLRNQWYAVAVALSPEFKAGKPRLLFEGPYINIPGHAYALAPDGERFLVLENTQQFKARTDLAVVTHFFDALRRRIAAPKS
jgi:serine/threonine-protein kinase